MNDPRTPHRTPQCRCPQWEWWRYHNAAGTYMLGEVGLAWQARYAFHLSECPSMRIKPTEQTTDVPDESELINKPRSGKDLT